MTSAPFPTPQRAGVSSHGSYIAIKRLWMAKKARNGKTTYRKSDLWIAPALSLKGNNVHQSDWKLRRGEPDGSNRYLELADVALGLAPAKHKTKRSA